VAAVIAFDGGVNKDSARRSRIDFDFFDMPYLQTAIAYFTLNAQAGY
jgi:hypothetical protein